MAVLVNFKICDNAKECGGIEVCPTGAIAFDEEKETIVIDNDKCISCGLCESECPIGAIMVANTDEEYAKIKKQIDDDTRTTKDLFVDRYGACPLSEFFMINEEEIDTKINNEILTLIEIYDEDLRCLLKSIPVKDITDNISEEVLFYNVEQTKNLTEKFDIKEYPCLLVFKNGNQLGKIEGYFDIDQKEEFENMINSFIK
jgi:Fe-S-cluster-containing hydrogenase components 1